MNEALLSMEPVAAQQPLVDQVFWKMIEPIATASGFEERFQDELNNWQKLAGATHNVVAPGNIIDVAGFASAAYGLNNLDSWKGIVFAGAGFMADFFDGKAARRTGTTSELGAVMDHAGDKIKLAYGLYKVWQLELAPKPLLVAIAVQNGLNASMTIADQVINKPPVIYPNYVGKTAIFTQQWGVGLNVIGSEVAKTNEKRGKAIKAAGTVLGAAGVAVGAVASASYATNLWHSVRSRSK